MPQKDPVFDDTKPVTWTIVVQSVHVIAYKLWRQIPDSEEWIVLSQGTSTDNIADKGNFETVRNSKFAYWLGIGSTEPNSEYLISIVLTQDGNVIENGIFNEKGKVNEDGVARLVEIVTLK